MHRRFLMELMQQWTRIKLESADNNLDLGLKIDAELFRLDSVIRWLNAADGRLMNAAVSAPRPAPPPLPRPRERAGGPPTGAPLQGRRSAADDRIRVSDRDREQATVRLRDSFAQGRLTREELDERITAALNARTIGDLRRVTADLP